MIGYVNDIFQIYQSDFSIIKHFLPENCLVDEEDKRWVDSIHGKRKEIRAESQSAFARSSED